ncbi:MAG TPA: TlpA disulfide reductase family protein [Gemmatimonadales bacterium]|nr:TlpA disulfide reductase family protein [Gemmatimonadales bacterium]
MSGAFNQWKWVAITVGSLLLGAILLVKFAPVPEGVEVGRRAPDFSALNLASGDSVRFAEEYAGQVTLVNIWATWCPPCRDEMPAMQELYDSLKSQGFRIAAISVDEGGLDEVRKFVSRFGLTFDILHDNSGRVDQRYQVTGYPESFLINRSGIIVKKVLSAHSWSSKTNRDVITHLLAGES